MINKAILIGNCGKDPEIRTTNAGKKVAKFSLATTEHFKDKQGNKQSETQWHSIVAWGSLAEICEKYIKKGQMLYIEGKIQYGSYDDKDGNKKYYTDIVASNIQMLGGRKQDDVAIQTEPGSDSISGTGPSSNYSDDLPY